MTVPFQNYLFLYLNFVLKKKKDSRNIKVHVNELIFPESLILIVLHLIHDAPQAGNPGRDKSLAMACSKIYRPKIRLYIATHVSLCLSCACAKDTTSTAFILEYPSPARPFETVVIDLFFFALQSSGTPLLF